MTGTIDGQIPGDVGPPGRLPSHEVKALFFQEGLVREVEQVCQREILPHESEGEHQ